MEKQLEKQLSTISNAVPPQKDLLMENILHQFKQENIQFSSNAS